jgi:TRAP transporter TAXI family solute receptor
MGRWVIAMQRNLPSNVPAESTRRQSKLIAAVAIAFATVVFPMLCSAKDAFVSVGSGPSSGEYYKISKALCGLVNRDVSNAGVWCSPEATPGSVYNLQRLRSGELDFGIVQSDVQSFAYIGSDAWADNAFESLRSVLTLHSELMTVLTHAGSGIQDLSGLKGRRLNVGSLGSGTRATWDALARGLAWDQEASVRKSTLRLDAAKNLLCSGGLDASLMLVGHPSSLVQNQLSACRANLIPLHGPEIDRFISRHPYYERGTIKASTYETQHDVPTFGVRATLVTSAVLDDDVVYALVKAVMTNFEEFKNLVPVLEHLHSGQMLREALTAPLHPGAERAFRELGIERASR